MKFKNKKIQKIHDGLMADKERMLQNIAKETKNKMQEYIETYWYDVYSPIDYERTYDVLRSIDVKFENDVVVIFYNADKIFSTPNLGSWGEHSGFDFGDFSEGIIEYVENGVSGGSIQNPRLGDTGAKAIPRTRGWLNNYLVKAIKKEFGINVKIRMRE